MHTGLTYITFIASTTRMTPCPHRRQAYEPTLLLMH